MQASGVLLLFFISSYWVFMETSLTKNPKELYKYKDQIFQLLEKANIPQVGNISVPTIHDQKCCQENLKIFMEATKTIFKENKDIRESINENLKRIQKFCLPECNSEVLDCEKQTVPFPDYREELKEFLSQICGEYEQLLVEEQNSQATVR